MRVVLATHKTNQWLGVNKYFYLLGKYLARLGVDVRIVVDAPEGCLAVREICGGSVEVVLLFPTAVGVLKTARYCWNLSRYLASHRDFDILHCGHVLPFFYLMRRQRKPVVFQPFGNELFTLAGRGMSKWYCRLGQPILRYCGDHSSVLLSEGKFQNEEIKRYYPEAKRLAILPVGVDINAFKPKENHGAGKHFQFLAVNSLLPYEGMDDLISAFRTLNSGCNKLVIVGTGSEENKLRKMADGLPVRFRKELSENELRALYAGSDAFICTTHETDVQMGVLEAMASGLPVLSRKADWLPKSVGKFRNKTELMMKMVMIASTSAPKRLEIAEKGLKEVGQYGFTNIAEKAVKIYEELLCNNSGIRL